MSIQRKSRTPLHERAVQRGRLAAIVTARREELGLRQAELAELAGCSERFVVAVEAGRTSVRLDLLIGLLGTLGLHLEVTRGAASEVNVSAEIRALYPIEAGE